MTVAAYLIIALILIFAVLTFLTNWGKRNRSLSIAAAIICIGGPIGSYYLMQYFYDDLRQMLVADSAATPQPAASQTSEETPLEQASIEEPTVSAPEPSSTGNTTVNEDRATNELALTYEGYGVIRFGDTVNQVEQVLGESITIGRDFADNLGTCYLGTFAQYPGLTLMVEEGVITRADADENIKNILDVAVGDSYEAVLAKYPEAKIEGQKYVIDGHEITMTVAGMEGYAILMLEDDNKITNIRAGLDPSVFLVETCS